jgi:hypothetical protein
MGVKLRLSPEGGAQAKRVVWGAEEDIWTQQERSNRAMEKKT